MLALQHLNQGRDAACVKDLLPVVLAPGDTPDRGCCLGLQETEIVRIRIWGLGYSGRGCCLGLQ